MMKMLPAVSTALAASVLLAVAPYAQTTDQAAQDAARAARMKAGEEAARGPQLGEGNPIPDATRKYTPEERAAAHAARRGGGATAAKKTAPAEGKPKPDPRPTLGSPERAAARAKYREEATRANKAGEIKSKGEMTN
jgi:hypothetical protein